MATTVVRQSVADYDAWRAVYDEAKALHDRYGITAARILRDSSDPLTVLIIHNYPTVEQARSFMEDPELRAARERGGATGAPRIEIYDDVT